MSNNFSFFFLIEIRRNNVCDRSWNIVVLKWQNQGAKLLRQQSRKCRKMSIKLGKYRKKQSETSNSPCPPNFLATMSLDGLHSRATSLRKFLNVPSYWHAASCPCYRYSFLSPLTNFVLPSPSSFYHIP